ncbi:MAG: aldo/keto reductase [Defluviitaleaceae bacterium]|nr:aldo/keto reductase [Defluviitaleaceae bacterium]
MLFNNFGKTGIKMSALGFGAMRLPMRGEGDKKEIDDDLAIPMMHRAFELGVNYIDTAPYYNDKLSEGAVGRALKSWTKPGKIYVSTKNPIENDSPDDWMKRLETSLKNLNLDSIDFYHFWGINLKGYQHWETLSNGPLQAAERAKSEGLIKHLSFSFHDDAKNLPEIINGGRFESVLVQYNLLDRSNEDNLAYAKERGLGVVVMGPVGGGKLGAPSDLISSLLKNKPAGTAEMAMRFVLANPNVDISLSGMSHISHVDENAAIASRDANLSDAEIAQIKKIMQENKKLAELYCTSCDYCKPCPADINIPHLFGIMNTHRVYGLTEHAVGDYNATIRGNAWHKSASPVACTKCGVCEEKCPQKLPIIKQLEETHAELYRD